MIGQGQGATDDPHKLGLWLKIRHPHNGRERWVASWLVKVSDTVITPAGTRTRWAGSIALANARLALVRNRDNLVGLATILSAIGTFVGIAITRAALRLQRASAPQSTP